MPRQNFKNHARYIPLWHFVTAFAIAVLLIGSIINLVRSARENLYSASLIVLISLILVVIYWYARWFALRAQDRAIRAEENLRHFAMTGKLLDRHLRTSQIIALRFASDEEFVELARKAAEQKMRSKDIKKAIVKWRSDHHRV
jgi:hypothetical protein